MKKSDFNSVFRRYTKSKISPSKQERKLISKIYDSFKSVLNQNCIQIGSYPRFTAIRPIHDLDILYIIGDWSNEGKDPLKELTSLNHKIETEYINPTDYSIELSLQSHSVTVSYRTGKGVVFSVDIVPAYKVSKNEFDDDTYMVPEILYQKHGQVRKELYQSLKLERKEMGWIKSDPRGYIETARIVNGKNSDFRNTVKFVKAWKNSCKLKENDFRLKSFHIEQVITSYFMNEPALEIFDGIFRFFSELHLWIEKAQIPDRAEPKKFIDEYIDSLSDPQKMRILEARDCFLIKLEEFAVSDSADALIDGFFYTRVSDSEQFLFDFNIPVLLDPDFEFEISAYVKPRDGGFREYFLDKVGLVKVKREIEFRVKQRHPEIDHFKWKVKNDNSCMQPRGEITDNQTLNHPEKVEYNGKHYVECFAIIDNSCVARTKQNVTVERWIEPKNLCVRCCFKHFSPNNWVKLTPKSWARISEFGTRMNLSKTVKLRSFVYFGAIYPNR